MDVPLAARLRAGVAMFNAGYYHAAHDAWEPAYLTAEDERRDFLQGLIQFTAAAHHAARDNHDGATGLATSALAYLDEVAPRGLDLDPVRAWLRTCRDDVAAAGRPPPLELDGERPGLADLEYPAAAVAAPLVAAATSDDADTLRAGAEYALADLRDEVVGSPFVTLVLDFLDESDRDGPDRRGIVAQRLAQHVQRRQSRESDVEGLFD
jgi:hypothetical protein